MSDQTSSEDNTTETTDSTSSQAPASAGPGAASAGVPSGAAPSGATSAGHTPEDARDDVVPAGGSGADDGFERAVPGQPPGAGRSPVPSPGTAPGVTSPGVRVSQGASPQDGVHAGDKAEGSDASVSSPGAWTAAAAPGKPDGEVDTRSR